MRTAPAVSELSVRLTEGTVDECRVRLDSQQVSVKSVLLNRGGYSYLTGPAVPGKEKQEAAPVPGGSTPSLPWTVRVGSVVLDRQPGGIRAAEPSSRSGIRPVVHRPLDARPGGRFDLQPGCGHSPANPPHGVHRAQRAHGERHDRGHRHGRLGHIPCRRHPENALFPDRGQHLRRGGDSGTGSGFATQGRRSRPT